MMRALDLFCCAGGATRGLQLAGFHVTGVDHEPQPRYCGDAFHQADALTFPIEGYDFIWASPPCQKWTALRFMPTAKEHPDLIPQTRAREHRAGERGSQPDARDLQRRAGARSHGHRLDEHGHVVTSHSAGIRASPAEWPCPQCNGEGDNGDIDDPQDCELCGGLGTVSQADAEDYIAHRDDEVVL